MLLLKDIFKKNLPPISEVVESLLAAEKTAQKSSPNHTFSELIGTWQLRFFTEAKKSNQGQGRYVPSWLRIYLTYEPTEDVELGQIGNSVQLGILNLTLSGPAKFLGKKNIIAFDFLRISISLWGRLIYQGWIRGGQKNAEEFKNKSIQKQPFFAYFFISEEMLAARGREGGLAIWTRELNRVLK
jgi:hypothetical protein